MLDLAKPEEAQVVYEVQEVRHERSRDKVEEELLFLEERDGVVKPEAVVEYAKKEETALHSRFDWNDGTAAHQWRLQQARQILSYFVTIIPRDNKEIEVRAFYHIEATPNNEAGYVSTVRIFSDEEKKKQLLGKVYNELQSFRKKYSALSEVSEVIQAIEKLPPLNN